MNVWQAVVLGVVEGITEYLPVSSTGHLILTTRLLGLPSDRATNAFTIVIQAGAIFAVLGLYRARVAQALKGLVGKDPAGLHLGKALVVAFVPAAVIGKLLGETIKEHLFSLPSIAAAWIVGGVVLLAAGRKVQPAPVKEGEAPSAPPGLPEGAFPVELRTAFAIGLIQTLAMWPGTSRSLATILGGVILGLPLAVAVEFSFLLGVLTLGAATAYELTKEWQPLVQGVGPTPMIIGMLAAWGSAALAVRGLVAWLQRGGLAAFGVYRIVLGLGVVALLALGHLADELPKPM